MTEPDFREKFLIWRYLRKGLQISPKSDTMIFFSKTALTIFLGFGLKLVLNMTFNLKQTYFSEIFPIGDIWPRNRQKIAHIEVFGHFLDFVSLVFLDFAHNDRCAWCLVVFLQFTCPVNVFLFFLLMTLLFLWLLLKCILGIFVIKNAKSYYDLCTFPLFYNKFASEKTEILF